MGMHGYEKTECEGRDGRDTSGRDSSTFFHPLLSSRPQSYGGLRRTLAGLSCQPYLGSSGQRFSSLAWAAGAGTCPGGPPLSHTWAAMCPAPPSGHLGGEGGGEEGQALGALDTQPVGPVLWDRDGTEA